MLNLTKWTQGRAILLAVVLDASYKNQLREVVKTYITQVDKDMAATPYGVPPSRGGWGGSGSVVDFGARMYFLHQAFPDLVSPEYTLRAANYILGGRTRCRARRMCRRSGRLRK
ncbi:hypothetical protein SBA3_2700015 [Candidatus Sulfopaludibacter sp. SbA3]|nr:hypothetical protein SBA3_2700015 [Candidatus Sulfopaludibacter sp. SbA3]